MECTKYYKKCKSNKNREMLLLQQCYGRARIYKIPRDEDIKVGTWANFLVGIYVIDENTIFNVELRVDNLTIPLMYKVARKKCRKN